MGKRFVAQSDPIEDKTETLAVELISHLSSRISNPEAAKTVLTRVRKFQELPEADQPDQLPSIYLLLEQYLKEIDSERSYSREQIRSMVRAGFAPLLEHDSFALIFTPLHQQQLLLCRETLITLLEPTYSVLGMAADNAIGKALEWANAVPEAGELPIPFSLPGSPPEEQKAWIDLLRVVSHHLFFHIAEKLGEGVALRIYKSGYEKMSERYMGLETFPIVISLLPEPMLDEQKIALLSRSQVEGGLVDKLETYRKENETLRAALKTAERDSGIKERLLNNVSHDLRTPLNVILGYADMLVSGYLGELETEQIEALDSIIVNTRQMTLLINDLIDQSQIDRGVLKLNFAKFEPVEMVEDVISSLQLPAKLKELSLVAEFGDDLPDLINGDRQRIQQILNNLVYNAIKFTDVGQINVKVNRLDGDHWQIEVVDTGRGIPEEDLDKVFDRFHQIDRISGGRSGIGLGLSIVENLVNLMQGRIELTSTVGEGSSFKIKLPIS